MSPLAEGSSPQEEPASSLSETPTSPEPPHGLPSARESPEAGADGQQPTPEQTPELDDEKRRYPSTIGGACYLVILAVTIAGLGIVAAGHWRAGLHAIAAALLAGAVLRFVLPQRDAGMLAVRSRWIDCTLLGTLGVLLWVLASTTPNA